MTASLFHCGSDLRYVGDPIDVVTGANSDVTTDLAQRGPILLLWTRYYNSARSKHLFSLGWGHTHGFDRRLIRDLDGLRYLDPHGNVTSFPHPAVGSLETAGGIALTRIGIHSYLVEREGQPNEEFRFGPQTDVAPLARLRLGNYSIGLRYGERGGLCEIVDSRGRTIMVDSDNSGRIVKLALVDPISSLSKTLLAYQYDAAGNLVRATDLYNTSLSFAYDAANRMTRRTDRRGYSFHFEYDTEGRCIHSRGQDGLLEVFLDYEPDAKTTFVRRGDGGHWIYTFDDNKNITGIIDPYGNATKFIIDERGRPIAEIDPNGNATTLHYDWRGGHDYRLDPNGNVLPTRAAEPNPPDPLAYQLPDNALEWEFGSLVEAPTIGSPRGNDPVLARFPTAVHDAVLGRTPSYNGGPINSAVSPALINDFGYPLEQTSPHFSERWKYDVNGKLVEHRDRDGSISRITYKSWNAQAQLIDPLGNTTSFDYTTQGLVARVTDPGGTITEYRYDLRDQLVDVWENGQTVETYRRDSAGNIVQKANLSGEVLITWEVGQGNLDKVRILASGEKHLFEHNVNGRIVRAQTPAGVVTLDYDEEGNLLADQRDGKGIAHEFKLRRLVASTYFNQFKVNYQPLESGDVLIQDPTGARHRFQISGSGLLGKHLANGSSELCQFNSEGRCCFKALHRLAPQNSLWMRGYTYSPAGDLIASVDSQNGTTKYRHDAAHRLIEEVSPDGVVRRFGHDTAGNLVSQPGLTNVVLGDGNRLKQANEETFTYNNRFNLCQREGPFDSIRYEYNELDMLVGCNVRGEAWTASYDGFCRRTEKIWRGQTTTYYWDDFRLAAEIRHDGSCRLYIYADDVALVPFLFVEYASLESAPESGTRYYVFTNQVGAPIRVEDDGGKPVWSAQIGPYGIARIDPKSTVEMPLRFPGHYYDRETGLQYNRFRYFSPEFGRYLQPDPAGQYGCVNLYAYPKNPLTGVDIDGLGGKRGNGNPPSGKRPPRVGPPCLKPIAGAETMSEAELKAAMEKKAQEMWAKMQEAQNKEPPQHWITLPNGQRIYTSEDGRGPCLSVVVDRKTGQVYYGQNTLTNPRTPLAEPLQTRTDERLKVATPGDIRKDGTPGSHSEVIATDQALKERPDAKPEDMSIYNLRTQDTKTEKAGTPMTCCPNCTYITGANQPDGAKPLTGARDPYEGGRYGGQPG